MEIGHPDLWRFLEMLVAVGAIFVPLWWASRQQNKRQHTQNIRRFDYLINEAAERPHHQHLERQGPLCAENIRYSPRKFEGD